MLVKDPWQRARLGIKNQNVKLVQKIPYLGFAQSASNIADTVRKVTEGPENMILTFEQLIDSTARQGGYYIAQRLTPISKSKVANYFKKRNYIVILNNSSDAKGKNIIIAWLGSKKWFKIMNGRQASDLERTEAAIGILQSIVQHEFNVNMEDSKSQISFINPAIAAPPYVSQLSKFMPVFNKLR